jgi:hypothetical protein
VTDDAARRQLELGGDTSGRQVLERLRAGIPAAAPAPVAHSGPSDEALLAAARARVGTCRCGHARSAHVSATAGERQGCTECDGCVVFVVPGSVWDR